MHYTPSRPAAARPGRSCPVWLGRGRPRTCCSSDKEKLAELRLNPDDQAEQQVRAVELRGVPGPLPIGSEELGPRQGIEPLRLSCSDHRKRARNALGEKYDAHIEFR